MSKITRRQAITAGVAATIAIAVGADATAGGKAVVPAAPPDDAATWSKPTRGLQARITLVERPKYNGTRSIVPYLELRNTSSNADPLKVRCHTGHVYFELVDADGKVVRDGSTLPRSGPHADPGTIVLPHDSAMRIGMHCTNWGVPKDAAAMISTDSGAWVLKQQEKGKVFLRATVKGAKVESDPDRMWYGTIVTPAAKVDWKEAEKKDADEIEGTWTVVNDDGFRKGEKWVIAGGQIREGEGDKIFRFYKLDPSKTPKCIDVTLMGQPDGQALAILTGIYSLEDDQLKVYLAFSGKERPTAFPQKTGPNVLILKRQKP